MVQTLGILNEAHCGTWTKSGPKQRNEILRTSFLTLFLVAGARGFEPRLTDPKTGVLPLDDAPTAPSCPKAHRAGCSVPNGLQTVKKKPTSSLDLSLGRNALVFNMSIALIGFRRSRTYLRGQFT